MPSPAIRSATMSLPQFKKAKRAGEDNATDATNGASPTAIERVVGRCDDSRARGETATTAADSTLARILRRRQEPRVPQMNARFPREVVEYEFVDADTLLNINSEQSDRLISFLEDESGEDRALWLSNRCFLRRGDIFDRNPRHLCHVACTLRLSYDRPNAREYIHIDLVGMEASLSSQPIAEGDALLRILSKHCGIHRFHVVARDGSSSIPASVAGLQLFVSDIPSGRRPRHCQWDPPSDYCRSPTAFSFAGGRLSEEHKRALAFRCHRKATLAVHFGNWASGNGADLLLEAIRLDRCPTRLSFHGLYDLTAHQIRALFESIERNTCLESLEMSHVFQQSDEFQTAVATAWIGSLSRNRGLRYLSIWASDRLLRCSSCWKLFWTCIAGHPTLRVLQLWEKLEYPEARLEEMAECLQSNTALQTLWVRHNKGVLQRAPILRDRVLPILQLNQLRPKVSALMKEADPASRSRAFWSTLIDDETVRSTSSLILYLLTEAADLFVEGLSRRTRESESR